MADPMMSREVRLASRPTDRVEPHHVEIFTAELPALKDGEFLVRNRFMSVDPYMLGLMQGTVTYAPPFAVGEVMRGEAVGVVVETRHPGFPVGAELQHYCGWRDSFVSDGDGMRVLRRARLVPLAAYLDILGQSTGLAAYAGLFDVANVRHGETVFVTAGAGAVGAAACQLALAMDCHVVASAGTSDKARWLEETIGVSEAFCYRDFDSAEALEAYLAKACPNGIDVMFENVGGMQLEAALQHMNDHGRIALCGMISYYKRDYNNDRRVNTGPRNFIQIAERWLKVQGFSAPHYTGKLDEFESRVGQLVAEGRIRPSMTMVRGLENAVRALNDLMDGRNTGKMIVEIS
jgi:NADPH-dependent curcumin reductase CurA